MNYDCDCNVFYFYFHVFIRHIREFAFVAHGRRRRRYNILLSVRRKYSVVWWRVSSSNRLRHIWYNILPGPEQHYGVRIGHINAQSLVPKVDVVNKLLQSEHLDLLCVSET